MMGCIPVAMATVTDMHNEPHDTYTESWLWYFHVLIVALVFFPRDEEYKKHARHAKRVVGSTALGVA
jgi:hypothetical protein